MDANAKSVEFTITPHAAGNNDVSFSYVDDEGADSFVDISGETRTLFGKISESLAAAGVLGVYLALSPLGHTHIHTRTHTHIHTHTHMHTCTHAHIHTHTTHVFVFVPAGIPPDQSVFANYGTEEGTVPTGSESLSVTILVRLKPLPLPSMRLCALPSSLSIPASLLPLPSFLPSFLPSIHPSLSSLTNFSLCPSPPHRQPPFSSGHSRRQWSSFQQKSG